jgi:hypothetical protein
MLLLMKSKHSLAVRIPKNNKIIQKNVATEIQEVQPIANHSRASVIHIAETDVMRNTNH